jgi:hypothetical protein
MWNSAIAAILKLWNANGDRLQLAEGVVEHLKLRT